jgi:hypothetical protein
MAGEPIDRNEKRPALERADASEQDSRAKKERASDWDFRSAEIAKRVGAFLPHWSANGATYAVTFRLADSLPRVVLEAFLRERRQLLVESRSKGRELTTRESKRLHDLHSARIEAFLNSGKGGCVLRDANHAQIVKKRNGALWQAEYFDHFIRDDDDLEHSIRYVLENPKSAGLSDWPWSGTAF